MDELIFQYLVEYPILTKIIIVIGILRMVFKPLMTVLAQRVEVTASDEDNKKLEAFKASWWYVVIAFLLDFTASIKIPTQKKKKDNE